MDQVSEGCNISHGLTGMCNLKGYKNPFADRVTYCYLINFEITYDCLRVVFLALCSLLVVCREEPEGVLYAKY